MERKRVRTLLMASVTIMLCMGLLIGGTYALWSKTVSVTNHLVAGNLDLKLERIALSKKMLDNQTGYMKTVSNTDTVDLTRGSDVNVFGIEEGELVVPTSYYEAEMRLTNNGSVAFKFDYTIKLKTENNTTDEISELAKQLKVYIDDEDKGYLSTFITTDAEDNNNIVDGKVVVSSCIGKGTDTSKTFKVKIEFVNDQDDGNIVNNTAMNKEVKFDLIVKAVQLTSDPSLT